MRESAVSYIKNKHVVISFHRYTSYTSPASFLLNKTAGVTVIEHPFAFAKPIMKDLSSTATVYKAGRKVRTMRFPAPKGPEPLFWIKDMIATTVFLVRMRRRQDIEIAMDPLNALIGIVLRAVGLIRKVVFYTIDVHPEPFSSRFLNRLYHQVDHFCCRHADCIWILSPKMMEERFRRGLRREACAPWVLVPWGSDFDSIKRLPIDKINRRELVFMGVLDPTKAPGLVIEAMPEILKKVPEATLKIIGTGSLDEELKALARNLDLDGRVEFTGHVKDHAEIENYLTKAAVAVAPYVIDPDNYTNFADPGKTKIYAGCGLPVIMTRVSVTAGEIEKRKAGIIIPFDRSALAASAILLLTDDKTYSTYRANAISWGAEYSWPKIYQAALTESRSYLE